jgi:cell division cycle 20, cofactor of APC complex
MEKSINSFTSDESNIEENPELTGHSKLLSDNLTETGNSRVLAYKNKAPAPCDDYQNSLKVMYSQTTGKRSEVVKSTRHISSAPVRILDAPNLLDDYCKLMLHSTLIYMYFNNSPISSK